MTQMKVDSVTEAAVQDLPAISVVAWKVLVVATAVKWEEEVHTVAMEATVAMVVTETSLQITVLGLRDFMLATVGTAMGMDSVGQCTEVLLMQVPGSELQLDMVELLHTV